MARNVLQINLKEGDADSSMLAKFLRGGAISSRAIDALSAFYLSLAVAENPDSTKEDIRKAEHYCLSKLKGHICFLMDKHSRDSDIKIEGDDFATVMIDPPMSHANDLISTRLGKSIVVDSLLKRSSVVVPPANPEESTGQRLSRENQERSNEVGREISARLGEDETRFIPPDKMAVELLGDEDDDYDPDDDLTDEEYSAKVLDRIPNNQMKIVD